MQAQHAGSPARSRTGPGRAALLAGLALLLGGLGMLGYVAWQLFGTNVVARQAQERIVDQLEQEWSVVPGESLEGASEPDFAHGQVSALIRIPAFGDDYVVPVLDGVGDDELAVGFGHFPGSVAPGEPGNYALAAHRVTHGEPLRDMPELRPGDEVIVETAIAVYTYVLDTDPEALIVDFTEGWVVDPLPQNPWGGVEPAQRPGQRLITLTTCAELFATDDRMIAFGHLVDVQVKGP